MSPKSLSLQNQLYQWLQIGDIENWKSPMSPKIKILETWETLKKTTSPTFKH